MRPLVLGGSDIIAPVCCRIHGWSLEESSWWTEWFETAVALFVHGLNDLPKRQAEAILQSNQWTRGKSVRDPKQRLLLSKLPQLTAEYLLNDVVQQQQQQQQQQKMKPTTIPLSVPIVA